MALLEEVEPKRETDGHWTFNSESFGNDKSRVNEILFKQAVGSEVDIFRKVML